MQQQFSKYCSFIKLMKVALLRILHADEKQLVASQLA